MKYHPFEEGPAGEAIEERTAKIPSDIYLWSSVAAMGTSLALHLMGKKHLSQFIGQWVTPFSCLGFTISW